MSAGAGGQARRGTGSSQQIGKSAALTVGALALARAAPRRMGTERSSEFGRVHHDRCPHARARRAPIPASCATELRRADRPARAGAAAVGRRRHFVLADCCSQIGATMELGRSWRSMLMSAGAGGQARRGTGSSQQIGKSAALTVGALALARAAPRRMGTERPSEFGRVHHDRCPHARAHYRETRRLLTNRPGLSFSTKSPIPTNVYASAIGLCKDSIIMQSRKPSNSDF